MFNPLTYDNSRADGFGVLQVVDDAIVGDDKLQRFVPLKRTTLTGEICGPLASLQVRQRFAYAAETCDKVLEALYRFPLPGDAAVTGVRVRFGEVEIVAELKEREAAEADYADAKAAGKQAALLTRESPDVFTLQVAGIRPGEDVVIDTAYVQLAQADGLGWTLRSPLTTAPRYVRSDELGSAHSRGQPLAILRDPDFRFSLDVTVRGVAGISSDTHKLVVNAVDGGHQVSLAEGEILPDRDFVLAWQPVQQPAQPWLTLFCHDDAEAGFLYFLAQIAPPSSRDEAASIPREVMLLVDHSGSMTGAKWAASDWAVERFLSDLTPADRFGLCLFHTETAWFSRSLTEATSEAIEKAVAWLKGQRDSGGTNLGLALEEALRLTPTAGDFARNVLVITDAQVTDDGRILRLADGQAARTDGTGRRISVLCIDAAPNAFLALQLAEHGGGIAKFLTSSPAEDDITTALDGVLTAWGEPVLTDLRLCASREGIEAAANRLVTAADGHAAIDIGDLPAGQARWVAGRLPRGDVDGVTLSLQLPDGQVIAAADADLASPDDHPQIKALFGARRVNGLEFLINAGYAPEQLADPLRRLGYDPAVVRSMGGGQVYAETSRKETEEALRHLLVHEALAYGLPSSATAFIAVRSEAGVPVEESVVVANALPAGWSGDFVSAPGFAATARSALRSVAGMALPGMGSGAMPIAAGMPTPSMMAAPSMAQPSAAPMGLSARPKSWTTLYESDIHPEDPRLILYDSFEDALQPPAPTTITGIQVQLGGAASKQRPVDPAIELQVYVEDMAAPRAKMRLVDLLRLGERPLNLLCQKGARVQIVLVDPNGVFAAQGARLTLAVRW